MEVYLAQIFSIGNPIIDFFLNTEWSIVVATVKVMSFVISGFFIFGIFYSLKKHRDVVLESRKKAPRISPAPAGASPDPSDVSAVPEPEAPPDASAGWSRVQSLWRSTAASDKRLAVIEADALLDDVLKELRFPGENLGERLKRVSAEMANIEGVWFAHKLRNAFVHDLGYPFNPEETERALRAFEGILRSLGAVRGPSD